MPISEILGEVAGDAIKETAQEAAENAASVETIENEFCENSFNDYFDSKDISEADFDAFNQTLQSLRDCTLPNESVENAVHRACDFFGIPEVPIIETDGTCVWTNGSASLEDDIFGFNREQLMEMGVSGEDSLTLVYTHECAHRCVQDRFMDAWTEELACDYFSGVHAGLDNINLDNFEASLGCTEGWSSHPAGALRAQFIEAGKQYAIDMTNASLDVTFDNCMSNFIKLLNDKQGLIAEYRERVEDRMFSENAFDRDDMSFKGFVDDKEWNMKQANYNFEQAKYHEKESAKATDRGDYAAAKDHLRTAQSYNSKGNEYLKAANQSNH